MQDAQGRPVTGRVRWRKFAVLAVPGFAATAALAVALAQGALAASFAVSGQQFKISADSLDGKGFAQYGGVDVNAHDELIPVAVTSIKQAELKKLCQSVVMRLPILGAVSLNLHAGGSKPVQATDLFLDATQMSGDAEFTNIEIGRDASTLDKGPEGAQGMTDVFAQQADRIQMTNVHQTAWATNAGSFRLNGLDLKVLKGERECF
ncbi:cholesterol esterase [Streptomyces eurocidicus]|uniref:Cholesterol esterase n=1 Tax=Streptomyces eurocidicus TaxID=66423 RepID=A0A2N8P2A9_STREU|nr:DUF6230 family protein [Streptomyces eurocidicus]MBB5121143.1 hypothetical protein [Streptomyces eurocidicus]MBF6054158.1 cholesterol esterase [Streptomyces eurocidicus]PNE35152.1 cholesterol esterase [Streptomyces eurocidicus]